MENLVLAQFIPDSEFTSEYSEYVCLACLDVEGFKEVHFQQAKEVSPWVNE